MLRALWAWMSGAVESVQDREHPILSFLLSVSLVIFSITFYLGHYSSQVANKFYDFDQRITDIDQSFKLINQQIEKKTADRYTNKEAEIQVKAYDQVYRELTKRIETLEKLCFQRNGQKL